MTNTTTHLYQPLANREYKSTVFTTYFGDPERAANLYRSLSGDETVRAEDIELVTLEDAIYLNRKNDFAFTSRGKVLIIGEHQSTINPQYASSKRNLLWTNYGKAASGKYNL